MTLSGRDRAELRAEAHHLTALVHVGQHGLSPTVIQSLDDALRTHEAAELATATDSTVVQVIGKTATFYRYNPELKRKRGDPPLWRTLG